MAVIAVGSLYNLSTDGKKKARRESIKFIFFGTISIADGIL
jgi:hypothetical protein